jgi:hypothetical protein
MSLQPSFCVICFPRAPHGMIKTSRTPHALHLVFCSFCYIFSLQVFMSYDNKAKEKNQWLVTENHQFWPSPIFTGVTNFGNRTFW